MAKKAKTRTQKSTRITHGRVEIKDRYTQPVRPACRVGHTYGPDLRSCASTLTQGRKLEIVRSQIRR